MRCREGEDLYRVFQSGVTGWKLRCAKDEARARKGVRNASAATIVRPSSYWDEQRRLGNYPTPAMRRTRRK